MIYDLPLPTGRLMIYDLPGEGTKFKPLAFCRSEGDLETKGRETYKHISKIHIYT
jgi:hypothetical protein